jgi:hypothetical protein
MSCDHYESLCQSIDNMADWKAGALCTVCAAKVAPIIARLGLPDTWRLVEECLEFVWGSVGQYSDKKEALRLTKALESTPEWQCEDNSFLPFAVKRALDFIKFALLGITSSAAKEEAKKALSLLVEVAESFDTSARKFPSCDTIKPIDIRLQASEESSQERLVKMLEKASAAPGQTMAALRQEANVVAELFRVLLLIYCYDYVRS